MAPQTRLRFCWLTAKLRRLYREKASGASPMTIPQEPNQR